MTSLTPLNEIELFADNDHHITVSGTATCDIRSGHQP